LFHNLQLNIFSKHVP